MRSTSSRREARSKWIRQRRPTPSREWPPPSCSATRGASLHPLLEVLLLSESLPCCQGASTAVLSDAIHEGFSETAIADNGFCSITQTQSFAYTERAKAQSRVACGIRSYFFCGTPETARIFSACLCRVGVPRKKSPAGEGEEEGERGEIHRARTCTFICVCMCVCMCARVRAHVCV